MGILKVAFLWVLSSSIAASITALFIIMIKLVFKTRISSRTYCMLWLLVAVRLIVTPVAPGSPMSIFNLLGHSGNVLEKENTTQNSLQFTSNENEQRLFWNSIIKNKPYLYYNTTEISGQISPITANINNHTTESANNMRRTFRPDILSILCMIWLFGLLTATGIILLSCRGFTRELGNAQKVPDSVIPLFIRKNKYRFGMKGDIPVFSSSCITNPCIFGLFRPRIFIPEKLLLFADDQQITHILMHEFAHYRRKDNLTNFFIAAVNIINWFNPILWYTFSQFRLDREASCDAYALEILGEAESVPYGMTLLNFRGIVSQRQPLFELCFFETKKQIERRIIMIKMFKKGSYKITVAALLLCLAVSSVTLTNAADYSDKTQAGAFSSSIQQKGNGKFKLGGSDYHLNSFERARSILGFDFKVPDKIPSEFNSCFINISEIKSDAGKEYRLGVTYSNLSKDERFLGFQLSRENLLERRKSSLDENSTSVFKEQAAEISGVKGTILTEVIKPKAGKKAIFTQYTIKAFVWKENGIWYLVDYYALDERKERSIQYCNLSTGDLEKLVASMTDSKNCKNSIYVSMQTNQLPINDEKDLIQARKMLGFTPKFPLSLPGGYLPSHSDVMIRPVDGVDIKRGKYYFMETIYNKTAALKSKQSNEGTIFINQYPKDNSNLFGSLKKNPKMMLGSGKPVPIKSVTISGIEVLFAEDASGKIKVWKQNKVSYESTKNIMRNYVWEQNNTVFEVRMDSNDKTENAEKIIEAFMK